jgi:hypothetical protein
MVCSKFCLFKTKQNGPHFDAPKAYQRSLPFDSKSTMKSRKWPRNIYDLLIWSGTTRKVRCHTVMKADFGKNYDLKTAKRRIFCYLIFQILQLRNDY